MSQALLVGGSPNAWQTQAMLAKPLKKKAKKPEKPTPDQLRMARVIGDIFDEEGAPTQTAVADEAGISVQAVAQWRTSGKIGKKGLLALAKKSGRTAEEIMAAGLPATEPAPINKRFADGRRSPVQQVMEDLDALHPDDRRDWVAGLHSQAEKAREIGRQAIEGLKRKRPPEAGEP